MFNQCDIDKVIDNHIDEVLQSPVTDTEKNKKLKLLHQIRKDLSFIDPNIRSIDYGGIYTDRWRFDLSFVNSRDKYSMLRGNVNKLEYYKILIFLVSLISIGGLLRNKGIREKRMKHIAI